MCVVLSETVFITITGMLVINYFARGVVLFGAWGMGIEEKSLGKYEMEDGTMRNKYVFMISKLFY